MALALYDSEQGYYARSAFQVGRGGDFFTSVSVGCLFGELLARRFLAWWRSAGRPPRWRVVECGAHDGTLAADLLETLGRLEPEALAALEYVIPEPLPRLREAQRVKLERWQDRTRLEPDLSGLAGPLPGIVFGNELLDALPFHVVEWQDGWQEKRVAADGLGGFTWEDRPIPQGPLAEALAPLGGGFPPGYRTEIRIGLQEFLAPLAGTLTDGMLLWIDYGFARPDLYHPDRTCGTLRTFSKHRAGEDPLAMPGEQDITAHVDFSAVAEISASLGCPPVCFRSQGSWLTSLARDWLAELEGNPDPKWIRQFQTLTHPGQLGARFHVLECAAHRPDAVLPPDDARGLALDWRGACD